MPSTGTMAYYPAFPPAIRLSGVGCIRVAHPCATLRAPEGTLPVRLACIRPAASVHPEPGSNSSLYYCLAKFLSLNLGFRLDTRPRPRPGVPLPARRSRGAGVSCAGLRLSKNFSASLSPLPDPSSSRKAGAKVQLFSLRATTFLLFLKIFYISLIYNIIFYFILWEFSQNRVKFPYFVPPKEQFCPT